jgi:hypothetical protein
VWLLPTKAALSLSFGLVCCCLWSGFSNAGQSSAQLKKHCRLLLCVVCVHRQYGSTASTLHLRVWCVCIGSTAVQQSTRSTLCVGSTGSEALSLRMPAYAWSTLSPTPSYVTLACSWQCRKGSPGCVAGVWSAIRLCPVAACVCLSVSLCVGVCGCGRRGAVLMLLLNASHPLLATQHTSTYTQVLCLIALGLWPLLTAPLCLLQFTPALGRMLCYRSVLSPVMPCWWAWWGVVAALLVGCWRNPEKHVDRPPSADTTHSLR